MTKKNYISIITFLVLFTIGFIYLSKVFVTKDKYINTTKDFIKLSEETNIDIVFYGSSYTYTSCNPLIINHHTKTISYNLGSVGMRTELVDALLDESLKYTTPKLVVLEARNYTMTPIKTKKDKGYQLIALDFISNFSIKKMKIAKNNYNFNEYLSVYNPLIRNHSKWNEFDFINLSREAVFNRTTEYFYDGFRGDIKNVDFKYYKKYSNFKNFKKISDSLKSYLDKRVKENLSNFIKIAKKNKIKVLIITPPQVSAKWTTYYTEELQDYCDTQDVLYLNLNNYVNEIDLSLNDFQDLGHLNIFGSTKVSEFLANYINDNFSIKDRTSTNYWKKNKQLHSVFVKNFTEEIFSRKVDFHLLENLKLNNIKIIKTNNYYRFNLNFKISLNSKLLGSTKLGVRIYPKKNNLKLKKGYDSASIKLNGNKENVLMSLSTKIDNIKEIQFYLYKGNNIIGNVLHLKNINFK